MLEVLQVSANTATLSLPALKQHLSLNRVATLSNKSIFNPGESEGEFNWHLRSDRTMYSGLSVRYKQRRILVTLN